MPIRALFLDVGNTLLTERPSRFELYARAARDRGVEIDEAAMSALMRLAHREVPREVDGAFRYTDRWFERYIECIFHEHLGLERAELEPLATSLFARFSLPETFVLFPGALELITSARDLGLRVGVVSNWSTRLPGLLERLGLAARLDFVVCSAIERLEKPDRAIFDRALALARVDPEAVLHAGDDVDRDVAGALEAGLRAVLVDHAGLHPKWVSSAAPRVTHLDALSMLVRDLAR